MLKQVEMICRPKSTFRYINRVELRGVITNIYEDNGYLFFQIYSEESLSNGKLYYAYHDVKIKSTSSAYSKAKKAVVGDTADIRGTISNDRTIIAIFFENLTKNLEKNFDLIRKIPNER